MQTIVLEQCPQAVWYLKTRALTLQDWIDDTEVEEEVGFQSKRPEGLSPRLCVKAACSGLPFVLQGLAELLMDDNATAAVARPGTSLKRPKTSAQGVVSFLWPCSLHAAAGAEVSTAGARVALSQQAAQA